MYGFSGAHELADLFVVRGETGLAGPFRARVCGVAGPPELEDQPENSLDGVVW